MDWEWSQAEKLRDGGAMEAEDREYSWSNKTCTSIPPERPRELLAGGREGEGAEPRARIC